MRNIAQIMTSRPVKVAVAPGGGASHGTLVPLHPPLLGFCFFFYVGVCVCVVLQIYIVFTSGAPNKAVKKKEKKENVSVPYCEIKGTWTDPQCRKVPVKHG